MLEAGLDFCRLSAVLVDLGNTPLEVDAGTNRAQHFVAGPEHAFEKLELLRQQFVHAGVGDTCQDEVPKFTLTAVKGPHMPA